MKKFVAGLVFVGLAAAIGIGAGFYFSHQNNGSAAQEALISEDKAQEIALRDAGVRADAATALRSHLEREDGRAFYDIQFKGTQADGGSAFFEYEVDAQSGQIIAREREAHGQATASSAPQAQNERTADEATAIALKHAGVSEADALRAHAEYEREATGNVWSVDFETATTEYDYDIDAQSGEVLASSSEPRG